MTREEAIENLKELLECNYIDSFTDEENEALEIAINALHREQQFLDAGYKNSRVEFNIGGRRFMVKELAQ